MKRPLCRSVFIVALYLVPTLAHSQLFRGDVPMIGDFFGRSVAIDDPLLVIGAPGDDEGGQDAGAAYVYERDGSDWNLLQKLVGSQLGAQFGFSVAVVVDHDRTNDGDFVAVGSLIGNGATSFSGSVTMYHREPGLSFPEFAFQTTIAAADGSAFDEFGYAVDLDLSVPENGLGDNPDPVYTLAVGAPDREGLPGPLTGVDVGGVYIIQASPDGSSWAAVALVIPDDLVGGDYFGRAVAISGELVVAGATGWPTGPNPEGVAYLIRRFNDTGAGFYAWSLNNRLDASNGQPGDRFGASVAITPGAVAVGAPNAGDGGAVYIVDSTQVGFNLTESVVIPSPTMGVNVDFGLGVALDGALLAVADQSGPGVVHVLRRVEVSDWRPLEILRQTNPDAGFAHRLAFSKPYALVGDIQWQGGGAAYIVTNQLIFAASFE